MAVATALAVGAGIQAVSALAQLYQSEQARKANKARLKEIKAAFDALIPPGYDVSIMDPPELIKDRIPEPAFDMSKLQPEEYKLLEKFVPEQAAYIAETDPTLVADTAAGKEGLGAQRDALNRMRQIAQTGEDPEFMQKLDDAARRGQIESQSRSESILQDAARRGRGGIGGGTHLAAQLQGSSDAMREAGASSRKAATESFRNQLQAMRDSAGMGQRLRGQELDKSRNNADIINSFNQRMSSRHQDYLQKRADRLNRANLRNLEGEQRADDKNVGERNRYDVNERDRMDRILRELYGYRKDERNYQNDLSKYEAGWAQDQRAYTDDLRQRQYDNEYKKTQGAAGIAGQTIQQTTQGAQDRNAAVQGFGDIGATGARDYYGYQERQDNQARDDKKFEYEQKALDRRRAEDQAAEDRRRREDREYYGN